MKCPRCGGTGFTWYDEDQANSYRVKCVPCDGTGEIPEFPILNLEFDTPVHEAIGVALGAASVCWENPGGAGVFDSVRATAISEELLRFIQLKVLL